MTKRCMSFGISIRAQRVWFNALYFLLYDFVCEISLMTSPLETVYIKIFKEL